MSKYELVLTIVNKDGAEGGPFQVALNMELDSLDEAMEVLHKFSEKKKRDTYPLIKTINPQEDGPVPREKMWQPVWDSDNTYPC